VDEEFLGGRRLMVVVGSFHEFAAFECGAGADERDQVWAFMARQPFVVRRWVQCSAGKS
jgi:hypothetical protein